MSIAGKLKGRYEIREILAQGGMGVVYVGFDSLMKRPVAIKTLLDMTDENAVQLFQKECEDLASLTHPNIIEIYDVGHFEEDGVLRPYLVMPLLHGVTLDKLIRSSSQRLSLERSVDIICQACRGLQAAHERGLVHRDIKPSNLFVMDDDSVKIIDFGVAHRVETSRTMGRKGTLLYMSPEQIAMKPLSPAADIYSLGVVCYEALTGRRPFERASESSVAEAILHFVPSPVSDINPAVNRTVSQAIHKAMAKEAWHRYASAREFGDTLQKALHNEPIELFNPERIRPRLQRARETYERGDLQFASEIVGELEAEGHLDSTISELRRIIDASLKRQTTAQLLETARSRMEDGEHQLALQKVYDVLQIDPSHGDALVLKNRIEKERSERDLDELFRRAYQYLEASAFGQAREAIRSILQLKPAEIRAIQLQADVDRLENEYVQLHRDNEQAYLAAVEAAQVGDLASAIEKLERVIELDRRELDQRPSDRAGAERSALHRAFYDKARLEYESVESAYAAAKQQLEVHDFAGALSLCSGQLAKYPGDARFQALKIDIEERQRQSLSATVADAVRRVESEADLARRAAMLEAALKANPGEPHLERLLERTEEKRRLVESIVIKARINEQEGQFADALAEWEMLQTIYGQYPGLNAEIDRLVRRREQNMESAGKNKWIDQIQNLLEARDYLRAIDVIGEARKEFPGAGELEQLETRAWRGLGGASDAGQPPESEATPESRIAALQQEYALDKGNPVVRATLVSALLEQAKAIVDATPGDAEQLLRQAIAIDSANPQAKSMLDLIEERRHERLVEGCLYQARWLESQGDVAGAVRALEGGLRKYPNEARLLQLRESLKPAPEPVKAKVPELVQPKEPEPIKVAAVETGIRPASSALPWEESHEPVAVPTVVSAANVPAAPPPVKQPPAPAKPAGPPVWAQPKALGGVAAAAVTLLLIFGAVKLFSGRKPAVVVPATPQQAVLEVTTLPPGALVLVDGKESGTASSPLGLPLNAGTVQVEARLPGYQAARGTATLQAGVHTPLSLTLTPILALKFLLPGDGEVTVNDEQPVKVEGGAFSRELTPGTYSVKVVAGRSGLLSFTFQVDAGGPATLTAPPNARDVSGLLISNFGEQGRVYTTGSPVKIKLDGQALGELTKNGLDLPKVAAGSHELELGENQDLRKKSADFGPNRTLTAIIDSDPNTGTLVVQTNEDGAAISVLSGGKEVARGVTKAGRYRVPNLRARGYVVRATKDGFDVDNAEQSADVQKGQDKTVAFAFRRRPQTGTARIRLTVGSELIADGTPIQGVTGDTYTARELKPGTHTFRAQKGKQFLPNQKSVDIVAGETSDLDLRLAAASIPVEIKRSPAESVVTYTKAGDPTAHTFTGSRQELPDGDYTFTARAKGFLETVQEIHLSWDFVGPLDLAESPVKTAAPQALTSTDWGKGVWAQIPGWYTRKGGGIIYFPKPLGTGTVEFTIHWQGKGRAQWILNASDDNYLQAELNDDSFQLFRVTGGKKPSAMGKKKSIAKMASYTIRIEVKPDGVTHKLQKDGNWETIDSLADTVPAGGKFGFNIPNGQELFLANFSLLPER
ncbi:MAG TPA: protein kinase [Bryobacteraceae bacterium]|jgi:serine/threonine-protein kinase|nr:protein kinase [Bryobacteraceae bacterium]